MGIGPAEIIILAIVVAGVLFVLMTSGGRSAMIIPRKLKEVEVDADAITDAQVQNFIAHGRKIEAIKRYRELTGLGLKESKDAIDYVMLHRTEVLEKEKKKKRAPLGFDDAGIRDLIQQGHRTEAVEAYRIFTGVDEFTAREAVEDIERDIRLGEADESHLEVEIRELLRQGRKVEALRRYREQMNLGLQEAKDAVEALEQRPK